MKLEMGYSLTRDLRLNSLRALKLAKLMRRLELALLVVAKFLKMEEGKSDDDILKYVAQLLKCIQFLR